MKIEKTTGSYNERRYSKPWIATVDFSDGKGKYTFGNWIGKQGDEGILVIDANPHDIICIGQKDFRKPRNSDFDFYQVSDDGELNSIGGKSDAYKTWKTAKAKQEQVQQKPETLLRSIEIPNEPVKQVYEQQTLF